MTKKLESTGNTQFIWWTGVVEDINDPLKLSRVRVRIHGYHSSSLVDLPTGKLPWALCVVNGQPSISGLGMSPVGYLPGTWVLGFFEDGETAQMPIVFGSIPGRFNEKPNNNGGFCDPEGKYPLDDRLKESDVNRLARNEQVSQTSQSLIKDRYASAFTTAGGGSWEQLVYNREYVQYPFNKVYEGPSGTIIEVDDTPGYARINIFHPSGTFFEIHPSGACVMKSVNQQQIVVNDNFNVFVGKNINVTCEYDTKILVGRNADIEVHGNLTANIDGKTEIKSVGDMNLESNGNISITGKRIDLNG